MLVSNGSFSGKKKSRFFKNQKVSGLLSKLVIRIPSKNIPLIYGTFKALVLF